MQDAMETAAQSEDKDIAEELLRFFVDSGEKECFAALLFTCYDLIKPDVALEVRPRCFRCRRCPQLNLLTQPLQCPTV